MTKVIDIAGIKIGTQQRCFIIAEAGVNHNGDLDLARRLIDVAKDSGADAVKFQTYKTEAGMTPNAPKAEYQMVTTDTSESQFEMLKQLELTPEAHRELQEYCVERGILFLSSIFDEESAELLEKLDVPSFKIPSGEITNLPLLRYTASKGRPMILSTGMSDLDEVRAAVQAIQETGNQDLILLHCVSAYPAPPEDINLRAMRTLEDAFDLPIGFSDHTLGVDIAVAAVAMGACVIEKHFTLDRTMPGPDHQASLTPNELHELVRSIRNIETAMGDGRKEIAPSEVDTAVVSRKSVVAVRNISAGITITGDHVGLKSPATGLPPSMMDRVIGRTTAFDIPEDTLITLEMLV
jgi:N,N'-diacetyllegionaminate synthase